VTTPEAVIPPLKLTGLGNTQNLLTISGAGTSGTKVRLNPASAGKETILISLENCRNVRVVGLHFTGPEVMGYGLQLRNCQGVLIEGCSWTDMTGVYYGATGTVQKETRNIMWRSCLFRRVGSGTHAHMIYNAYGPRQLVIESCWLEDCSGEFVRFRDETDDCTVRRCTFKSTSAYRNAGYPFISIPMFNDDDPAKRSPKANPEYFGTRFTIAENAFEYPETPTTGDRIAVFFQHIGYDPPLKRHLLTAEEGKLLSEGSPEQKRQLLLSTTGIDLGQVRLIGNQFTRVKHPVAYHCKANYGAQSKGWAGIADLTNAVRSSQ